MYNNDNGDDITDTSDRLGSSRKSKKKRHRSEDSQPVNKKLRLENELLIDVNASDTSVDISTEKSHRHKRRNNKVHDLAVDDSNDCELTGYENPPKMDGFKVPDVTDLDLTPRHRKKHRRREDLDDVSNASQIDSSADVVSLLDTSAVTEFSSVRRHKKHRTVESENERNEDVVSAVDVSILETSSDSTIRRRHKKHRRYEEENEVNASSDVSIVELRLKHRESEIGFRQEPDGDVIIVNEPAAENFSDVESVRKRHKKHRWSKPEDFGGSLSIMSDTDDTSVFDVTQSNNINCDLSQSSKRHSKTDHVSVTQADPDVVIDIPDDETQPVAESRKRKKHRKELAENLEDSDSVIVSPRKSAKSTSLGCEPDRPSLVLQPTGGELRFRAPTSLAMTEPTSCQFYWEDIATAQDKELWLIRAPVDCQVSDLDNCVASLGQSVSHGSLQVDVQATETISSCAGMVVVLPSRQDRQFHLAAEIRGVVTVSRNTTRSQQQKGSLHKKKKRRERSDD